MDKRLLFDYNEDKVRYSGRKTRLPAGSQHTYKEESP